MLLLVDLHSNPIVTLCVPPIAGFREAFNLFDETGRGHVTSREFYRAWNAFGFTATEAEIESMLQIADTDGSGELEYDEFVMMIAGAKTSLTDQIRGQLAEMREVFSLFDPNGDGSISADEIGAVLREDFPVGCGWSITDETLSELLAACDEDASGELDFSEFVGMMAPCHKTTTRLLEESLVEHLLPYMDV